MIILNSPERNINYKFENWTFSPFWDPLQNEHKMNPKKTTAQFEWFSSTVKITLNTRWLMYLENCTILYEYSFPCKRCLISLATREWDTLFYLKDRKSSNGLRLS